MFSVALVLGGAATGSVAWLAGGLVRDVPAPWRTAVLLVFGAAMLLRDFRIVRFPLPEREYQVPRSVFQGGVVRAAFRFGFELGTGFRTRVTSSAAYFLLLAVFLLVDELALALLVGAGFGLGRAAFPLARYWSRSGDAWDARLAAHLRWLVPASSTIVVVVIGFRAVLAA